MKCPLCGKPTAKEFKPFCSERCQQVDLGKWLHGSYALPGEPIRSDNDEAAGEE